MNFTTQSRLRRSLILNVCLILQVTTTFLFAEDSDSAFKTLSFKINCLTNTNRNLLHQYWQPFIGGEVEVKMPFYAGNISVGLQLFQFKGISEIYPDYLVSYFYMGWGGEYHINSTLSGIIGIRLGSYQMNFDDTDINPTQKVESELASGIDGGINLKINSKWRSHIGIGYITIFTYKKIELLNISLGISYTIDTPSYLKEFLK